MKKSVLVVGITALALAGTAAWAAQSNVHQMTIQLPGGGVEHIEYTGNVAPKVRVVPMAAMPQIAFMPMAFPNMARIQAVMDAQMAQMNNMIRQANVMAAQSFANLPNGPIAISAGNLPAGSHFCAHSIQITTGANGKQNVVTHTAGDCGGGAASAPANHSAAAKGSPI
jgi:Flp pilus assembly protein CpaB